MLLEREIDTIDAAEDLSPAGGRVSMRPHAVAETPVVISGRYGEGGGISKSAVVATLAVHAALGLALLGLGAAAVVEERERLTVVELSIDPPPPPPAPPSVPEDVVLETTVRPVVTPLTLVQPPVLPVAPPTITVPVAAPPAPPPPAAAAAPPAAPAPSAPPSIVTNNDLGTRMISGDPPSYPMQSRRNKEQGLVELLVLIGVDGRVETISVARSSGFPRLDKAALHAVRKWRWAPTVERGQPVQVRGIIPIPFQLQGA